MSAEENSPVDCFRRRSQGAKRREGARHFSLSLLLQQGEAGKVSANLKNMKFTFCFSTLKILMIITFGAEYSWPPSLGMWHDKVVTEKV